MSLADEIIAENAFNVRQYLQAGIELNTFDEYGFTYLVEACVADNIEIAQQLIQAGADVNLQDSTGNTPLHWACENNNLALCKLLLEHGANPNAYNFAAQPVLTMPLLRHQQPLKKLLLDANADVNFARDYINTKLLGHMYELIGTANLIAPDNNFVEVDFEGFFLEFSIGVIADSVKQYGRSFGARKFQQYKEIVNVIVATLERSAQLIKFLQYRTDLKQHTATINNLIHQEPLIIPVGYEGHAVTFVKLANILAHCDRREDTRQMDRVMFYNVHNMGAFTQDFIRDFIYAKKSDEFVNVGLKRLLNLQPITELHVEAQISGNCSWANVEATIPVLFFLLALSSAANQDMEQYKKLAMNYFRQWREWNKDKALKFCIESFNEKDSIRNLCKAEVLAAILFQRCARLQNRADQERVEAILAVLLQPEYRQVLDNYVRVYCYESLGQEGRDFLQLIRRFGYDK